MLATRVARLYQEVGLPDGAFNLVTGFGHEIGDSLTGHPLVRLVNFTGSSRVGRHIAGLAGEQMKRVTLELGGKNPLLILADADLDQAVAGATHWSGTPSGSATMWRAACSAPLRRGMTMALSCRATMWRSITGRPGICVKA